MSVEVDLLPEPELLFGGNDPCIDPRLGLLSFGPSGVRSTSDVRRIRIGAIGTYGAICQMRRFLERLRYAIPAPRSGRVQPWHIDFPGLGEKGPLKFELELDSGAIEYISDQEHNHAMGNSARKKRIEETVRVYEQRFEDLAASAHPAPSIVLLPLSKELVERCKDPRYQVDRILYERRTLNKSARLSNVPVFDFHHVLKVIAFRHNLATQVLLPSTVNLSRTNQDPATIAWNFTAASYYKGTGWPWKLADIDDRTCLLGISFFEEIAEGQGSMRASMAHVYLKTAESQIIRGKPFRWAGVPRRQVQLSRMHAREIVSDAVELFERQRGVSPSRVVIHKTSPFTLEESEGFDEATNSIDVVDYIHIESKPSIQFFHEGEGYPPVRGTLISSTNGSSFVLYTVGFIAAYSTYPGSTIPRPLVLHPYRLDSSKDVIATDILALSKLDWNNTDFCSREPVTTSVSRKVGHILAEMRARDIEPPQAYRFYM
ncbi:MAG: hypothetical protein E3J35_06465 [Methanomassiliicoccales archaeon]|nr:MAG: hypothetical protein E3J35_06465 [Methanomassiliicoccales archaeon]